MNDGVHHRIAIIGAGFSGLGMAIRLKQEGLTDFVVIERASEIGGTWRDNTYPGCQCDIPSVLYSYSFAPNPRWTRTYPLQEEIRDYLRRCATDFDVLPYIRFDHEVTGAAWDDDENLWRIETSQGEITADILVGGQGGLSTPSLPDIPGLQTFQGTLFHSAQWNHDHDLTGDRVAVIGTGASSIQFVPEIAKQVARLDLYQRTAPWVLPKLDRSFSKIERGLYKRFPVLQRAYRRGIYWFLETIMLQGVKSRRFGRLFERAGRKNLELHVKDPVKRAKLMPDYEYGCKRLLMSNSYYRSLDRPNAEVITDGIAEIRAGSIVSVDGTERAVDAIILGTGFDVQAMASSVAIRGAGGHLLADEWAETGIQAHRGTMVAGFPNLFFLLGPNTGLGHNSIVFMIECQIGLAIQAIAKARGAGEDVGIAPTLEAQSVFNERIQRDLSEAVWSRGTCQSYYLDAHGRNISLWPGETWRFRHETRRLKPAEYDLIEPAPAKAPTPSSNGVPIAA